MTLKHAFHAVDKAQAKLDQAENDLKQQIKVYARQQGLLATPRPESVRLQLGL